MTPRRVPGDGFIVLTTEEEVREGTLGFCILCGEETAGVEPDARRYECEGCGEHGVYGLEELLFMRRLHLLTSDEEE